MFIVRLCAIITLGWAMPAYATPQDDREALLALNRLDVRVASIAYRLSVRNVALCPTTVPQLGLTFHAIEQYEGRFRAAAAEVFDLGDAPAVLAVVDGSPADKAGIRVSTVFTKINGVALLDESVGAKPGYGRIANLEQLMAAAAAAPPIRLTLRGAPATEVSLSGAPGCPSRVQVEPGTKLNAFADGTYVKLTSAVAEYANDDGELAAIIAHEMAHNILDHQTRLNAIGRSRANIRITEIEADRLSVKLLHGAGYDPRAAARFWARFGKKTGAGIFSTGTHLRTKPRVKLLEDEAALLVPLTQ
jgi:beta-barrel assembly-enhancing protease